MLTWKNAIVVCTLPILCSIYFYGGLDKDIRDQNLHSSKSVYDFYATDIDGRNVSLSKYRGRVLIVVNVASKCGLTDRDYRQLSELHNRLSSHGLSVAAFPSNQFAWQEPGSEAEIKKFVQSRWSVQFDMFAKVEVNGAGTHPLFAFLKSKLSGTVANFIKWNFTKFLIDKHGRPVHRFGPNVPPEEMEKSIMKLLNES